MIYVPFQHLKPGMVLARDVICGFSFFSLVVAGQKLTNFTIARLREYGVRGAYIESPICDDIAAEDFIDPEFKRQTISELKTIYEDYASGKAIGTAMRAVTDLAQRLLLQVLDKDECLVNIIEMKDYDTYTYTHSMYVGILSVMIGVQEKLPKAMLGELAVSGLLHDIGKLHISRDIVNKPGKLSAQEFEIMKTHPSLATNQLWPYQRFSAMVISGVESHHEKFDGSGYPRGLVGKNIPLFGRILALADVYDALTSERQYRKAWPSHEAIEYMMGGADTHFDHDLLLKFLRVVSAYPVGSVVRLSNGVTGVVAKNFPDNTLRPLVRVLLPEDMLAKEIDLANDREYLNVTVSGVLDDEHEMPAALMGK